MDVSDLCSPLRLFGDNKTGGLREMNNGVALIYETICRREVLQQGTQGDTRETTSSQRENVTCILLLRNTANPKLQHKVPAASPARPTGSFCDGGGGGEVVLMETQN